MKEIMLETVKCFSDIFLQDIFDVGNAFSFTTVIGRISKYHNKANEMFESNWWYINYC